MNLIYFGDAGMKMLSKHSHETISPRLVPLSEGRGREERRAETFPVEDTGVLRWISVVDYNLINMQMP